MTDDEKSQAAVDLLNKFTEETKADKSGDLDSLLSRMQNLIDSMSDLSDENGSKEG